VRSPRVLRLALIVGLAAAPLTLGGRAARASFFGSNGLVAYTCVANVCVVNGDGSGRATLITGGSDPVWSPDGSKLAYVTAAGALDVQTVTSGAASGAPVQVAGTPASQPTWSSSGLKIAYVNGTDGNIYVANADGSGGAVKVLSTPTGTELDPAWAPNGTRLAYVRPVSGRYEVFSVNLAGDGRETSGDTPVQLTSGTVGNRRHPSWSPDSSTIVYSSTQDGGGPLLYSMTSDGLNQTKLGSGISGDEPAFSPDETELVYVSATPGTLRTVAADGTGSSSTIDSGTTNADPDWQPTTASSSGGSGGSTGPPVNTSYPTIVLPFDASVPLVGQFVSATTGSWSGAFPITFTYQWKKCEPGDPLNGACYAIDGATSSFFTITPDVYQMRLRVAVTATNSQGTATQNSEATAVVTATPPRLTVTPPVVGQNMVDQTLSVTSGTWQGSLPMTFAYEWRRCNPQGDLPTCVPIAGATGTTYVPMVADIGYALVVYITATNVAGSVTGTTVHTYPVVDKPHFAPSVSTPPSIAGVLTVGNPLTAAVGVYKGDLPIATTLAWQRCDATGAGCHAISGATRSTYSPGRADIGATLRIAVVATNHYGTITALSDPSAPVVPPPPHCRGRRIVAGRGDAYIVGTRCDDFIRAGGGNDTIDGGGGYDTIYGGSGRDVITVPGHGLSTVVTGSGSATVYAANGYKDSIVCGHGRDKVFADDFDTVLNCAVVVRQNGP
jgi:Tol biopolymer transport system component